MIYGAGSHRYRVTEGWGCDPEPHAPVGMIAGVACDADDRVHVFRRSPTSEVMIYSREGVFQTEWGRGVFGEPHGIWVGADGRVLCTDRIDHTVRVFTSNGKLAMTLGTPNLAGNPGEPFSKPGKAVTSSSGDIWVADGYGQARVHRFSSRGELLSSWGEPGTDPGEFDLVHSIGIDGNARVIVVDRANHRLQVFSYDVQLLDIWTGFQQPMDVCVGADDDVFVAENLQRVSILGADGRFLTRWGTKGDAPGEFASFLHGICVDSHGDLYVADESRLQKFERVSD